MDVDQLRSVGGDVQGAEGKGDGGEEGGETAADETPDGDAE